MVKINKSIDKAYCASCGEHLPEELYDIVVGTEVSGGSKIYEINGLCKSCLKELAVKIIQEI